MADPFKQKTQHVATRDLKTGDIVTVGDLRAMFGGTRIPNDARVRMLRGVEGYSIKAEWEA